MRLSLENMHTHASTDTQHRCKSMFFFPSFFFCILMHQIMDNPCASKQTSGPYSQEGCCSCHSKTSLMEYQRMSHISWCKRLILFIFSYIRLIFWVLTSVSSNKYHYSSEHVFAKSWKLNWKCCEVPFQILPKFWESGISIKSSFNWCRQKLVWNTTKRSTEVTL